MATITPTSNLKKGSSIPFGVVSWEQINQNDTGGGVGVNPGVKRGTVIFTGTFDGGTWTLEGSIDGDNYAPLKDKHDNLIAATTASSYEFETVVRYFKVSVSGGTTSDVDVELTYFLDHTYNA